MISFKYKGNVKRFSLKAGITSEKLISAICRLFPIKGFILGFKSEDDSYFDLDSFLLTIEVFRNTVVEIVTEIDHNDISFSSDNVSSFVPPQEKPSPSPFSGGNRLFQVDNIEDAMNLQSCNVILAFTFDDKIADWVIGKITNLANKYSTYEIVFLYTIVQTPSTKRSGKSAQFPSTFKIYNNKSKLCQIKIKACFIQQIEKVLLDLSLVPVEDNSFVKTLKRIEKLDESPSFITRNIEDVMSKELIVDNLQQMCEEYIITDNELERLVDLVNNNFMEFSELFCKNLGDTDYEAFKKEIEGHLQRYRVLLNSLLDSERPISRDEQRQRRDKKSFQQQDEVEVLKIEGILEVLDELNSVSERHQAILKKLILEQNREILQEFQRYQKQQITQSSLIERLLRIINHLKQDTRPISRCIQRGKNNKEYQNTSSPEPNFNFNVFQNQELCSSEKSFGNQEAKQNKRSNPIPFKLESNPDKTQYHNPLLNDIYRKIYDSKELEKVVSEITLTSYEQELVQKHSGDHNPLVHSILKYYISIKNTSLESDSANIEKYLESAIVNNSLLATNLSWIMKFTVLRIFVEQFVQQSRITPRERDLVLIGFIENKPNVIGALELFLIEKSQEEFIDTIKLVTLSSLSSNSYFLDSFIFAAKFFLKGIYQYPKLLDYTVANYSSVFRGICQKQLMTLDFPELIENIDALNSHAFTKRFQSEINKASIPITLKQSLVKEFQKGNQEVYSKLINIFESSVNPQTLQLDNSFQQKLSGIAKEYGCKDRDDIQNILKQIGTIFKTPSISKMIKYYDTNDQGFCSLYQLYKLDNNKSELIENIKMFINIKQPGSLTELPAINQSPVLKKRYREKNDELFSVIKLLRSNSEEEVLGRLKEYEDKETVKVVRQTLSSLGLTGEKISKMLGNHGKEVTGCILEYLNTNNKDQLIFAIEPYLIGLAPENHRRTDSPDSSQSRD